jgi:hypothetical protein
MTTPNPTAPKDTKGKPGRKPGQKAKEWDYTGLSLDLLTAPAEVTHELASMAAPTRARDERQVAIDKIVIELHKEYEEAGKPDTWAKMPKRSYHVDPRAADTLRMLVRRAANFYSLSVRFGSPVRDRDGREIVVFGVRDQRTKAAKGKDMWTLAELREFITEFYGADDADGIEDFFRALQGESTDDNDESADDGEETSGEETSTTNEEEQAPA